MYKNDNSHTLTVMDSSASHSSKSSTLGLDLLPALPLVPLACLLPGCPAHLSSL